VCLGRRIALSTAIGAALVGIAHTLFRSVQLFNGVTLYQFILFGVSVSLGTRVVIFAPTKIRISWTMSILLLHSMAFLSNWYTFWEDGAIPFFLLFTLIPLLFSALSASRTRLRYCILAFSALFATCVRLMAMRTVCREEQHRLCGVTFFSGSGAAEVPTVVRVLLISAAVLVPYGIRPVLSVSKADNGIASLLLSVFAPALIAGSTYWLLESLDASGTFRYPGYVDLRRARTTLAWTSVVAALGGTVLCAIVPVALRVSSEKAPVALVTRRKCARSASPMPIGRPLRCSGRSGLHLSGSRRNRARR